MTDYENLLRLLARAGVEFIIVGVSRLQLMAPHA